MGLVSQEPSLFNETIRANISYGKEGEATESDVVAAARLANAHKFISSLHQVMPQLYDCLLPTLKSDQLSNAQNMFVIEISCYLKNAGI